MLGLSKYSLILRKGQKLTTLYLVDDDDSVRTALVRVLRSANIHVHSFSNVEELLDFDKPEARSCVVADILMPGTGGLEIPKLLAARGCQYPVIFLSAQDTKQTRAAVVQAGGAGFFRKPIDAQALLDAIEWAVREENNNGQSDL